MLFLIFFYLEILLEGEWRPRLDSEEDGDGGGVGKQAGCFSPFIHLLIHSILFSTKKLLSSPREIGYEKYLASKNLL